MGQSQIMRLPDCPAGSLPRLEKRGQVPGPVSFSFLAMTSFFIVALPVLSGCASAEKLNPPPEFNQKILLDVSDEYEMHQAPRSKYDVGDLQAFHTQHTLPVIIEDAFKEIFGWVESVKAGPKVESGAPDVPAIFEVRLIDVANDIYNEASSYRGQVTLAVAMKSPRGEIFWQKAFRGEGYTEVDSQYATGLGPQDAVVDAVRDAVSQMQKAILASPEVRNQLKYYKSIELVRREKEIKV